MKCMHKITQRIRSVRSEIIFSIKWSRYEKIGNLHANLNLGIVSMFSEMSVWKLNGIKSYSICQSFTHCSMVTNPHPQKFSLTFFHFLRMFVSSLNIFFRFELVCIPFMGCDLKILRVVNSEGKPIKLFSRQLSLHTHNSCELNNRHKRRRSPCMHYELHVHTHQIQLMVRFYYFCSISVISHTLYIYISMGYYHE